jgi:Bifunctional DNA primase/polymerase, N-terminal
MIANAATEASVSAFGQRARLLIERGIPVTPVNGKAAFLKDWPEHATTDIDQINLWAQQYPNANTGAVAQAKLDGRWFFEIDSPDVLTRLSAETGQSLPPNFTTTVKSRAGRGHFYWKQTPASISMGNISQAYVKGGDWSARVDNEYVVGPRSINPVSGAEYEMNSNASIIEAPQWLIDWLISQKVTKTSDDASVDIPKDDKGLIPHGYLHGYMLKDNLARPAEKALRFVQ